ncbi:MAG: GMC family oxidoreductase N-terminal domain-containing protein, partial [Anaerolinea sp.]|nr:GMC family oxidoreductase N-terminal domain-containing protein [Anaerolinea sp.]
MPTWDFVVVGSGFGGSVSAMRLTEKGYSVLVLERGKRFHDRDFPRTNWNIFKYLWLPALRCFGIQQISFFNDIMVLHGSGVGGGSLVYANVLMEPGAELFDAPGWRDLADWKTVLQPHYETARRMLGVTRNPCITPADIVLQEIASERGQGDTFQMADVGIFFGEPGKTVPDPYFNGAGPERTGCTACGGCMVGCRVGAKNTLVKNYLYFAEKQGAIIQAESEVTDIRPLPDGQPDGARYEVIYRRSTAWPWSRSTRSVRARSVVISAHAIGTMKLLFRCR